MQEQRRQGNRTAPATRQHRPGCQPASGNVPVDEDAGTDDAAMTTMVASDGRARA
jgi:hypothetical protein